MAQGISLEGFESHLVASEHEPEAELVDESAFRIALMGDWSGRANRGLFASPQELAGWRTISVDRDNIDEIIQRLGVGLSLELSANSKVELQFECLDDFHPDRIFQRAEQFRMLRDLRARISNSRTFPAAAAEMRRSFNIGFPEKPAEVVKQSTAEQNAPGQSSESLLDQVLAQSDDRTPEEHGKQRNSISSDLHAFVQEIVSPYLVPDDTEQQSFLNALDNAGGELMRKILHHQDFQALESAWRGVDFLVRRLDLGSELKLHLLDISAAEFRAAFNAEDGIETGAIYQLLVERSKKTFGSELWAVLAGNYYFENSAADARLLEQISRVAAEAQAPFLAGALASLIGCESIVATPNEEEWKQAMEPALIETRNCPTANHIGLALPRFLLRLPYGADTDPVEDFAFEEILSEHEHESLLWANPIFALIFLLGHAYLEGGWEMEPGDVQDIDGLPLYTFEVNGETHIQPCAEVLMTVGSATEIIDRGIMPLITMKETDRVRLGLFQSIALPRKALAGRWKS